MTDAIIADKDTRLRPARRPTMHFIGVSTGRSSIMRVFPAWARHLGIDARLSGIDCRLHEDPRVYRNIVSFIKSDPFSVGALVTTHKIDLLAAARDCFDELDHYADLMGEVSSISKRDGRLIGHAKDPISSGLSLEAFLPANHWRDTAAAVFVIGAGGSSIAVTSYLMDRCAPDNRPSHIMVSNRSIPRLDAMKAIHRRVNPGIPVEYVHCPAPEDNDRVVNRLPAASLVINATGLGKDAPGSPLTGAAAFPQQGYVWDFNYCGDLVFLEQARRQQVAQRLHIEDGWTYFIHGWTQVIAEVFHIGIPESGHEFDLLAAIADEFR